MSVPLMVAEARGLADPKDLQPPKPSFTIEELRASAPPFVEEDGPVCPACGNADLLNNACAECEAERDEGKPQGKLPIIYDPRLKHPVPIDYERYKWGPNPTDEQVAAAYGGPKGDGNLWTEEETIDGTRLDSWDDLKEKEATKKKKKKKKKKATKKAKKKTSKGAEDETVDAAGGGGDMVPEGKQATVFGDEDDDGKKKTAKEDVDPRSEWAKAMQWAEEKKDEGAEAPEENAKASKRGRKAKKSKPARKQDDPMMDMAVLLRKAAEKRAKAAFEAAGGKDILAADAKAHAAWKEKRDAERAAAKKAGKKLPKGEGADDEPRPTWTAADAAAYAAYYGLPESGRVFPPQFDGLQGRLDDPPEWKASADRLNGRAQWEAENPPGVTCDDDFRPYPKPLDGWKIAELIRDQPVPEHVKDDDDYDYEAGEKNWGHYLCCPKAGPAYDPEADNWGSDAWVARRAAAAGEKGAGGAGGPKPAAAAAEAPAAAASKKPAAKAKAKAKAKAAAPGPTDYFGRPLLDPPMKPPAELPDVLDFDEHDRVGYRAALDNICARWDYRWAAAAAAEEGPAQWTEVRTDDGKTYFWNEATNETSWSLPSAEEPAPAKAKAAVADPPMPPPKSAEVTSEDEGDKEEPPPKKKAPAKKKKAAAKKRTYSRKKKKEKDPPPAATAAAAAEDAATGGAFAFDDDDDFDEPAPAAAAPAAAAAAEPDEVVDVAALTAALKKCTVKELKAKLKEQGQPVGGRKADLVARLAALDLG